MQFDVARFGRVPVAGLANAEEAPGQVGVVVQEVEGDRGADVVEERCAVEADIGKDLPPGLRTNRSADRAAAATMVPLAKRRSCCRLSRGRRSPTGTDLWTVFAERFVVPFKDRGSLDELVACQRIGSGARSTAAR